MTNYASYGRIEWENRLRSARTPYLKSRVAMYWCVKKAELCHSNLRAQRPLKHSLSRRKEL